MSSSFLLLLLLYAVVAIISHVMELGAGCGVVGLVVAHLPRVTDVTFTDHDPGSVVLLLLLLLQDFKLHYPLAQSFHLFDYPHADDHGGGGGGGVCVSFPSARCRQEHSNFYRRLMRQ